MRENAAGGEGAVVSIAPTLAHMSEPETEILRRLQGRDCGAEFVVDGDDTEDDLRRTTFYF